MSLDYFLDIIRALGMGSCLSLEGSRALPYASTSSSSGGVGKRRKLRRSSNYSSSIGSVDSKMEILLHRIPGRMCLNGLSDLASLFTKQGRKGINQDAMVVWENFSSKEDAIFCGVFDGRSPFGHMVSKKAYTWGFDIRNCQKHLNPLTWPEILCQLALSAGLGPQLKKRSISLSYVPDNDEVRSCEDVISTLKNGSAAENAFTIMQEKGLLASRRSRHRLTPGTVKFAAFHVLSLEGSKGLIVLELADKIQKSGLRDLTTSKTSEASISVALTRDTKLFERIAPSTYPVRAAYRKDPTDAEAILSAARKKVHIFENGFIAAEDADDVERDEDSECDDVDEDPEIDDLATLSGANRLSGESGKENICNDVAYCIHTSSGTTALTLVKQGQDLVIGNIGDSRAVLGTRDKDGSLVAVQLTVDLKPSVPREAERIRLCKGRVFSLKAEPEVTRVWLPNVDSPGLAMARAFGDFCLKDFGLISVPEITHRRLTMEDEFVILATYGIWDVLSNEEVVKIVASVPRAFAARSLVETAAQLWRLKFPTSKVDDCAVVCLFLDSAPNETSISTANQKTMPDLLDACSDMHAGTLGLDHAGNLDYYWTIKDFIRTDGGHPQWFSPLEGSLLLERFASASLFAWCRDQFLPL